MLNQNLDIKSSRPILKWAGGKRRLVPFIEQHLPDGRGKRLVEPFAGGAALSLSVDFDEYLLSDINPDLINFYQMLSEHGKDFILFCRNFFCQSRNNATTYQHLRTEFNNIDGTDINRKPIKAALFLYLNRHGFNGLCRYNKNSQFNVPFGKYKNPYFPEAEMLSFLKKSDRISLVNLGFDKLLSTKFGSDDVIYCDPPYSPANQSSNFTQYFSNSFSEGQHLLLKILCQEQANNGAQVFLSNHDTPKIRELYEDAHVYNVEVASTIAAGGSNRFSRKEIFVRF